MKIYRRILWACFFLSINFFNLSSQGQWVWMNGDSVLNSNGNYGIQGVPDPANSPPSLYECCEWKDLNGNFWIFGGDHLGLAYNDLWKFDPILNIWTWMKGPGTGGVPANFGSKGVPSVNNLPGGRYRGALSWTDNNNNLWLFGSSGTSTDDLWKYEISSNQWIWMQGHQTQSLLPVRGTLGISDSLNTPGVRWENSVSWNDSQGNLWFFGGAGADYTSQVPFYNDMWKYDVLTNEWAWMCGPNTRDDPGFYGTRNVYSPQSRPCARACYSRWQDTLGNFYLFGGSYTDYSTYFNTGLNDVWKYNPSINQWAWIGGDTLRNSHGYYSPICVRNTLNIPYNSFENRSTAFDRDGNVWVFGGGSQLMTNFNGHVNNELWHYDIYSNEWMLVDSMQGLSWGIKGVASLKNHPSRKMGGVAWTDAMNNFWLFGGADSFRTDVCYNAMWKYTPDFDCLTNGLKEKRIIKSFLSSPNPTTGHLSITLSDQVAIVVINIINSYGQEVSSIKYTNISRLEIEINGMSGLYFVRIVTRESTWVYRVMKL